ncbi:zinc finger protein 358 [Drosophila rhopaloa]|uniref:Zinc finger protein 358 n=1 Tax=Drosophila rhopaloa TaxID=1041015 RepID=A0A6P4FH97_DRORH|nr:zinc finger protein 358 [Drosophila rhopaloa]
MEPAAIRPKPSGSGNRGALRLAAKKAGQKRIYHCGVCLAGFPRHLATKRHEQQCEAKLRRLFICRHCLTLYGEESRLERHRERKHADGQFLCLQCAKRYASATFLYRHVISWHGEQSLFYCAMCADNCNDVKTFSGMRELQEHAEEVHRLCSLESTASETGSLVDDTEDLEMLEENIEDILPSIDWDDDLTFGWPMDLDKESCIADATKPSVFVCPFCANGFSGSLGLVRHLEQVHERNPLDCCYCGKSHGSREALRSHLQRVHVLLRGHVCDVCRADFATADHLKKHVNSRHLAHRPHVCPTCGKGFAQRCHLTQHMTTDRGHGHGNFVCQLCLWPFFRAIDLERHVNEKHP